MSELLFRFHRKDVLDLQWSNDGAYLISGSVDNSCIIWDANKGKEICTNFNVDTKKKKTFWFVQITKRISWFK